MTEAKKGPIELHIGDVVRLRKEHPCGGTDWSIVRLGADIRLRCTTCDHTIMLPRSQLERRIKTFVHRSLSDEAGFGPATDGASNAS